MPEVDPRGGAEGLIACDVAHGADGRPAHRQNRRSGSADRNRWCRALRSAHAVPLTCAPAPGPPARPAHRRWALLADLVPLYPLYALLFADTGLSDARDLGALRAVVRGRDRGRGALRRAGRPASAGAPSLAVGLSCRRSATPPGSCSPGSSASRSGFVLWGLGGALASGAQEALLHDGLAAVGAAEHYARVQGWVGAAGLIAQVPDGRRRDRAVRRGGYPAAGWVSVGDLRRHRRAGRPAAGAASAPPVLSTSDPASPEDEARTSRPCAPVSRRSSPPPRVRAVVAFGVL